MNVLLKELVQLVRQHIGPVAAFRHSIHVNRLPKTRSGKTPRNSLQAMLNKKHYNVSHLFCFIFNFKLHVFSNLKITFAFQ